MSAKIPLHYVEKVEKNGRVFLGISRTRFLASDVVLMHVKHGSSIEWIVENFESLGAAKIHAALAYYDDHQAEIEAEIEALFTADDAIAETAMNLETLKAKIKARQG